MIKRKLEQMKIKEAKRVAKLLKAIPAKTKMELKVESKNLPYVPKNLSNLKNMAMAEKYQYKYDFYTIC